MSGTDDDRPDIGSGPVDAGGLRRADAEDETELAGERDGFARLWTPHRMVYIDGENKPAPGSGENGCPFCRAWKLDDAEGLVARRGSSCYVVMNLYPYSPGHVLICPYRHVADYTELTEDERAEVSELTRQAMIVIREVSGPQGFNLGMNQGVVGGAGIQAHLHQHVVPRWQGDANFMPIIAQTKPLPMLLEDSRSRLHAAWSRLFGEPAGRSTGPLG
ncbi:HIT family protein [Naumannella halotolerans]|uniref:HIT family protein n=1 Tax=Naumannella halotolerans TaxID=993414 RepID=UPI00370DBDF4